VANAHADATGDWNRTEVEIVKDNDHNRHYDDADGAAPPRLRKEGILVCAF
jgi:hypothetical protein